MNAVTTPGFDKSAWGALAFDLVLHAAPLADIRSTYGLTLSQFAALLATPAFVAALRDAQAQLREHGAQAGFVFRSRALAEDLLPDIYALAKDERTDAQLRHRIFESLARYAQLDPAVMKKGDAGGGVQVVFNLAGGIRGLSHVVPAVQVVKDD
ncbi:hypothetical protein [Paraburkholderia dinghuensis]|uniref:Uncharacterized protein n=1 Tax=Paraburkholderia dinghuensis TaxID=2305225 RepID=A0A3N6NRM7_9BURK|nr:hypothetical protein [Paraburkholderia dinghuensis]RQH02723.1 hypothetical protein D1Y85_21560 [Paraburkholderia dinghuensis]